MADARAKYVLDEVAPLYERASYVIDKMRSLREPLFEGDTIECPSLSELTVNESGGSTANPEAVTASVLSVVADKHPWINAKMPKVDLTQLVNGKFREALARDATSKIKNKMDNDLCQAYLARTLAWTTGTAATYHDNVAGDTVTDDDILGCKAAMLDQDGISESNLAWFVSSWGDAQFRNISGFQPNNQLAEQGILGIPTLYSVFGTPVFQAGKSILSNHTVATTAAVTTDSGVTHTYTVAAGHGLVAGMKVTVSGHDAHENIATPTAITSTTATTVVVTTDATTDGTSSDADGLITEATTWSLLVDLSQIFVAQQVYPEIRIVPSYTTSDEALQCGSIWGRIGRPSRARVLHGPGGAVTAS